jgi:hypothetical protein
VADARWGRNLKVVLARLRGAIMHANVGDILLVHGHVVGQKDRKAQIVEVRGPGGAPPFLVRYDDGHEQLVYPGPDAVVMPAGDGS